MFGILRLFVAVVSGIFCSHELAVMRNTHFVDKFILVCSLFLLRLTDAFNNARDRVRYLEVLSPHLEALEAHPSLPSLLTTVLPALTSSVKHMEGLSRAYARSGYLGILFTKVREGGRGGEGGESEQGGEEGEEE